LSIVSSRTYRGGVRVARLIITGCLFTIASLGSPREAVGQQTILTEAQQTITVEKGKTAILRLQFDAARISLADSTIANLVQVAPPREFLINGLAVGSTTLIIWNGANIPQIFDIEVVVDATALQTQLQTLFPQAGLTIVSSGQAVIVSGTVRDPLIARRAIELATQSGAQVINNLQAPSPQQIMLQVRFAEIRHSARTRFGSDLIANNVGNLDNVFGKGSVTNIETLSDGMARLFMIGRDAEFDAIINALKSRGEFRSLAEPNLITLEGTEASFLAGGEFPYPSVQQGGGSSGAAGAPISIQFKEFGVRLTFTPAVTNSGTIRLKVAPEVSSLDFANGVTISGFQIPSLLTRRAQTEVELLPGQHLALAGLMDNSFTDNTDKIPFLGDLPIIGTFFRSKSNQQGRTELLVLVTPLIVQPSDTIPTIPTGEPGTWKWDRSMKIDTTASAGRRGGGQP
jgi:pilus assembly protein CpaC